MSGPNFVDFTDDVLMVRGELADVRHRFQGLLVLALFDEKSWRLALEEGENKDEAGEDDMETSGYKLQNSPGQRRSMGGEYKVF